MKKLFFLITAIVFGIATFLISCSKDKNFGDLIAPSALEASFEVQGANDANPHGDGTGFVNFTVTAKNATTFRIDFGDGRHEMSPSGKFRHQYTKVGTNTYTAVISAVGIGGLMTSVQKEISVLSTFSDVEAENLLAGANVGDSKTWYWASDMEGFAGLGPQEANNGNGEFAYAAWWNASANDASRTCMYANSFIFKRTDSGITFEQTANEVFIPGAYGTDVLGLEKDRCYGTDVVKSIKGVKNVSFFPSSSKAAKEGKYNNKPYRGTAFEISDNGMMGWWVGASTYDIISVTNTTLIVRIMQPNSQYAWYHIFTSSKPGANSNKPTFDKLVWQDEFDKDGAPDASKWTYDLGNGQWGWGNNEKQSYTDKADNVIVKNGVLKITAKKEGSGYTSARIKTQGLYEFTYGKVEIRAKLPSKAGTWPALWMLGSSIINQAWPKCGEIDMMEQTGTNKKEVLGALHWLNAANNQHAEYSLRTNVDNTAEYHVYSMEWNKDFIHLFIDGKQFYEIINKNELPFNSKFFLIMNVALGGTLGGNIPADFTEDSMEVDYIRVYQ